MPKTLVQGGAFAALCVDALMAKSKAIRAAVTATSMLRVALVPAAARLIVRFLDAKGSETFVAAAAKACAGPP